MMAEAAANSEGVADFDEGRRIMTSASIGYDAIIRPHELILASHPRPQLYRE